ncbi:hypothetical protein, partial [Vibrio sinaloensis]|uniref:hypothetical protein n=2 Tax=Vibrionaceae TaxID=641 RepID=UPI002F42F3BD
MFNYNQEKKTEFDCHATGKFGVFESMSGSVNYVMTTAKLKVNADDEASKLTKHLLPIREILDSNNLNFNEVLQRDLDDHRVATKLIPYLLSDENHGPSYFPPIVAVLLPFENEALDGKFTDSEDFTFEDMAHWKGKLYGKYFSEEIMINPKNSQPLEYSLARYNWNSDLTKLVVIDGQHRAMALIALYRTLSHKGWEKAQHGGSKFQYYYRQRIEKLVHDLGGKDKVLEKLSNIEFPVTILNLADNNTIKPFKIARKLFVDVNKNARQPSESRIKLLSDSSLVDVFSREILNRCRQSKNETDLPIYAIEYDYPGEGKNYTRPGKWSALINLNMLSLAVLRSTFGPSKYIEDTSLKIGGKPNWTDKDAYMFDMLHLGDAFEHAFVDEGETFYRDDITHKKFPKSEANLGLIKEVFWDKIGKKLTYITANILPYKAHILALKELDNNWLDDDTVGALAKEAVFNGVGVYWTLKDTNIYWEENEQEENANNSRPDVIKAWESVLKREQEFYKIRDSIYYGDSVRSNVDIFNKTNTNAFYIGLVLSYASLESISTRSEDFYKVFVEVINSAISDEKCDKRDIFSNQIDEPLNMIEKMDTPFSIYFRYFF